MVFGARQQWHFGQTERSLHILGSLVELDGLCRHRAETCINQGAATHVHDQDLLYHVYGLQRVTPN